MAWQETIGFIGGAFITAGFVPQVVTLFRLKSAREISLPFIILFTLGSLSWLTYGITLKLFPVILWNSISLVLVLAMLYAKLKYGKSPGKTRPDTMPHP